LESIRDAFLSPALSRLAEWALRYTGTTRPPPEWQEGAIYPGLKFLVLPPGRRRPMFANEALFDPHIREASAKFGVEVPIIKAIIAAESSFNPLAFNPEPGTEGEESYGLMQILSRTARALGFDGPRQELLVPRTNIFLGVKLLRELFGRYREIDKVIAAYNAGRPRESEDRPGEFTNQEYVNRVLAFLPQFEGAEKSGFVLASFALPALILALLLLYHKG
jgi:soluble lytic murein transglycosylase-like protein